MIFREAQISDIKQIQVVRNSVKENTLSNPNLVTDEDCIEFLTVRGKGWVCEINNEIVGFSIADLKENNVWALFIKPTFEKQGIGKQLHKLLLDWYFSQTTDNIWLGTSPKTRAETFYRKAGWKEIGTHCKSEIKFEMTHTDWLKTSSNQLLISQPIIFVETERLVLREIIDADEDAFFEMDADPEVHKYLGNIPVKTKDEIKAAIQFIRQQYVDNGIGRWALIEKSTGEFVGWGGMKLIKESMNNHIDFYDVGYRLLKKHWNKGYATESAKASIKFGFEKMNLDVIYGTTHIDNTASRKALEKSGLQFVETFEKNGTLCNWFKITKEQWQANSLG